MENGLLPNLPPRNAGANNNINNVAAANNNQHVNQLPAESDDSSFWKKNKLQLCTIAILVVILICIIVYMFLFEEPKETKKQNSRNISVNGNNTKSATPPAEKVENTENTKIVEEPEIVEKAVAPEDEKNTDIKVPHKDDVYNDIIDDDNDIYEKLSNRYDLDVSSSSDEEDVAEIN